MAEYLSNVAGTLLNCGLGSSDSIADGKLLTTACNALSDECTVTNPHPDTNAAPVANTAAPGMVLHPATISK